MLRQWTSRTIFIPLAVPEVDAEITAREVGRDRIKRGVQKTYGLARPLQNEELSRLPQPFEGYWRYTMTAFVDDGIQENKQ